MKKSILFVIIFLAAVSVVLAQNTEPRKYALVIGNGAYTSFGSLQNAVNDANDVTAALQNLGFTVDRVLNAGRAQMFEAITRFRERLSGSRNTYGFFYYAGHAVQHNGVNFLIPANASIPNANYLGETSISVQSMLAEINDAGNALNIVVLDACRDFPAAWSRNISRGLSVVANQPADSIIVFATSAGSVAADGTGRNGLFTTHLLTQLRTSGLEVYDLFRRTSSAVSRASNGGQVPAIYSQFFEEAYLGARPAAVVQPPVTPQPPVAVQPTPAPAVTPTPQSSTAAITNELVRIQGGSFIMGSPANEEGRRNNETQRQVTVSSFMMSRYEITQREYREVIGTNPSNFTGDLNRPVESVSWFDAVEYCNRRSQREGLTPAYAISGSGNNRTVTWSRNTNGYRLPTEAEWEYACRAGTTTDYNTGASITASHANFDGIINRTITVGSYAPNAWGLYDMHGNVWEWCWDWYDIPEQRAQTDPRGASSGSYRVLRGGSWSFSAAYVRSAYRSVSTPTIQYYDSGFRVVRNVPGVTTGGS